MIETGERRMFTKKVTDDDGFISLSSSAQALYLHLSMSADDDGFSNQVALSMFKAHASVQDLEALLERRYIYQFENGVIVIKHWRMANALRKDRYKPTDFHNEFAQLGIKEGTGEYITPSENAWLPDGCQMVAERLPQDKISKDKISKDKINTIRQQVAEWCGDNDELKSAFDAFIDMRKKIKKPLTERALNQIIKKLETYAKNGDDPVEVLDQSTEHCWQTVYELKKEEKKIKSIIDEWENA